MAETPKFKLRSIFSEEDNTLNLPDTPSVQEVSTMQTETKPAFKLNSVYSEPGAEDATRTEEPSIAVTPEELYESESLAKKAYRLADVAGEGLLRGWKDDVQAFLETKVFPEFNLDLSQEQIDYLKSRYEPAKESYQKFTEETKEMMPRASYAAELGGALLPYLMGGAPAGVAANVGLGALEGGIAAAGKSEADVTSGEFIKDVGTGVLLGAGLGGAGSALMKVAPKAGTAALLGGAATPLITGEVDPTQMGAGATATGILSALASRRGAAPAVAATAGKPSGLFGKLFEAGKQQKDLTSEQAVQEITEKGIGLAQKAAESTDIITQANKGAVDTIFNYFDDQIQQLGSLITKETENKDAILGSLRIKVWKDLESRVKDYITANPNKAVDSSKIFETAVESLRKGIKESLTDPAEIQAAEKTIDLINNLGKIKDNDVSVTLNSIYSSLSTKPRISTKISGVTDPEELAMYENMTPEELLERGFQETTKPVTIKEIPERVVTKESESIGGDTQAFTRVGRGVKEERQVSGSQPLEVLRQKLEKPFDPSIVDKNVQPFNFIQQTINPEEVIRNTTRVFEKLFPGRSDLKAVTLEEIVDAQVKLNKIYGSSKSDFTRSVVNNAKKALASKEEELIQGTEFADIPQRRELYGAMKEAEDLLKTEDVGQVFKLIDNMVTASQQGRFQDFRKALDSVKVLNPEYASKLENVLLEKGGKWKNLIARQKANPLEKVETLVEEGIEIPQNVQQARKSIQEANILENIVGTISKETGLPASKAYQFIENLGTISKDIYKLDPRQVLEMNEALRVIKNRNPDFYEYLMTTGVEISDDLALAKVLEQPGAEFGFFPTTPQGVLIKTAQKVGLPRVAYKTGKVVGKAADIASKFAEGVKTKISEPVQKIKSILEMPNAERSQKLGKFEMPLSNAAQRGDAALRATVYMLSQQFPEFREMMESEELTGPSEE